MDMFKVGGAWLIALSVTVGSAAFADTLRVGIYDNPPKLYLDNQGEPAGIFVDLLGAIAEEEGWRLVYHYCRWQACLDALAAGELDLLPDVAHTPERARYIAFSTLPAAHSWSQLYRGAGLPIESLPDLEGRRVALLRDSVQERYFSELMGRFGIAFEAVPVGSFAEAFERVADGEADAAISNHFFGRHSAGRWGLVETAIVFDPVPLYFAAPPDDPAGRLAVIDRWLDTWHGQPGSVYHQIMARWLDTPVAWKMPAWLGWALFAGLLMLLMAWALVLVLERRLVAKGRSLIGVERRLKQFSHIFDHAEFGAGILDGQGRLRYVNRGLARLLGRERDALEGVVLLSLFPERCRSGLARTLAGLRDAGAASTLTLELGSGASRRHLLMNGIRLSPKGARSDELAVTFSDVTALRVKDERLRQAARVLESTREAVVVTDLEGRVLQVNPAFTAITGYREEEMIGESLCRIDSRFRGRRLAPRLDDLLDETGHWQGELVSRRRDGLSFPELRSISRILDERGKPCQYVHVFADISALRESEARLEYLRHHDAITGLPNRQALLTFLAQRLEGVRRENGHLALLILDLDRFKDINDSFSHQAGDELLKQVADRMRLELGDADLLARLGGDEFAIAMRVDSGPLRAAALARRVIRLLRPPFRLASAGDVHVGGSIGISLFPEHGRNAHELVQQADAALYQAKSRSRGGFQYFSEGLTQEARARIALESRLREAMKAERLCLHYQPQVDFSSGHILGAEALLRWPDGDTWISPERFIPIAEESGLILSLGAWVLRQACLDARSWLDIAPEGFRLAVNISSHQLREPGLVDELQRLLKDTGFPVEALELELTESALMDEEAGPVIRGLRETGLTLAIDDFGTGYSSLAYLKRFPIDLVKIDKHFVRDIPGDRDDVEIAAAIIAMSHSLGLKVLAEGVETREQWELLRDKGCDAYQGYLMSRALPPAEFRALLEGAR